MRNFKRKLIKSRRLKRILEIVRKRVFIFLLE